jgi:hypothetical protein
MRIFFCLLLVFVGTFCHAQLEGDFEFGKTGPKDFSMTNYDKDSSANALVLKEFGKAQIEIDDRSEVIFYHHVRIKILNKNGFDQANITIRLQKYERERENILELRASTFNLKNGRIEEIQLNEKGLFIENTNGYYYQAKFTFPDIVEGSVIEYSYKTSSPAIWNFHPWEFQGTIPKLYSEYWANIPNIYQYNAILRGYQQIKKTESEQHAQCISVAGRSVDCTLNKYLMEDVPAFYDEQFMTSRYNYISAIKYEIKTVYQLDGSKNELTKAWKDVDDDLKKEEGFGKQIRREKAGLWNDYLDTMLADTKDTLLVAKKVYSFIRNRFTWNNVYGISAQEGVSAAFATGNGNVGDINLSLISALRYAGIEAEPVILSTRDFEFVSKLYPVLTDFKYVVARFFVEGKGYFLDATEKNLPFGMLPVRCLCGEGRLISNKFKSDWINIPSNEKNKTVHFIKLKVIEDGSFKGSINSNYSGYHGYEMKEKIIAYNSLQKYVEERNKEMHTIQITGHNEINLKDPDEPLKLELSVVSPAQESSNPDKIYMSALFDFEIDENPFKSITRLYPVDFAFPRETYYTASIEIPANFEVESIPDKIGLTLPGGGIKYSLLTSVKGNSILISGSLAITKTLYSVEQYYHLKELYGRIIQSQREEIIIRRKL